jgi:hypothetical protein
MSRRAYWSSRQGRGPRGAPRLPDVYRAVALLAVELRSRDYLQEQYGYACVDAGNVLGAARMELEEHIEAELGYRDAWPLPDDPLASDPEFEEFPPTPEELRAAEDRIFDIIEFFHDHVSSGVEDPGHFHSYGGCGWHYQEFDPAPAQEFVRDRINVVLGNYGDGYVLSEAGQIEHRVPVGLTSLMSADPRTDDEVIERRIQLAVAAWRSRERSDDSMREAVRNLFDVLERLRPQIKDHMLQRDEGDLFNIANNFAIRHFNDKQKTDWESPTWLSWMFYVNLSTIHLVTRLLRRQANREGPV